MRLQVVVALGLISSLATAPASAGFVTNGKTLNGTNLNGLGTNGRSLNGLMVNGLSANGTTLGTATQEGAQVESIDLPNGHTVSTGR